MWRPILTYAGTFAALFVAHIIAAANDFDSIFRVIAAMITIQTLFAGLILHWIGGNHIHARYPVIALGAGLGWAYAGMQFSWTILIWVVAVVIIQCGTEKGLKYNRLAHEPNG
ncbi:MAG: hypothetical protein QF445_00405 [Candidatus Poseidoniaceae archaeon]|nr:hypothetical protein [Candidatus Poseidoniaceae archaeon]